MNRKSNIKKIACNVKLAKILSKVTTRRSLSGCQRNLVKIQEFFHLSFVFHEATMLAPDAIARHILNVSEQSSSFSVRTRRRHLLNLVHKRLVLKEEAKS